MKVPIPDDWNGVDWECYSVEWPSSEKWKTLLRGFLTLATRGRYWEESTGSIVDVQAVGREIERRNVELNESMGTCNDDIINILSDINLALSISLSGGHSVCCLGGEVTPTTPGVEGGMPPYRYTDPADPVGSPEYDVRQCKLANMGYENILAYTDAIDASQIDLILSQAGREAIPVITAVLGGILAQLTVPYPVLSLLVGGVVGFGVGLAIASLEDGVEFAEIVESLENNAQEYVCALYNSGGATEAKTAFLQVAIDSGLSVGNQGVLGAMLWVDWLNVLYFNPVGISTGLNAAVENYVPNIDCGACVQSTEWEMITGDGEILVNGTEFQLSSADNGVGGYDIALKAVDTQCPINDCVTLVSFDGVGSNGFGVWEWDVCPTMTRTVNQTAPEINTWQAGQIGITSTTPFVANFIITPGVCP